MKKRNYLTWMLVLTFIFLMVTGNMAQVMAKSSKATAIKSVFLKIGKKKVTKKTYTIKPGEKRKLKVTVSPQKGKKTIKFITSKIKVTVKADKTKKTTWMKIKVTKSSGTDKNTATEQPQTPNPVVNRKSIVVYFSCTENTKTIAEYIKDCTSSDIYRIEPSVPYTSADLNYGNADSRTSKEQNDMAARPGIAGNLPSLTDYEIVYLGYPKMEYGISLCI